MPSIGDAAASTTPTRSAGSIGTMPAASHSSNAANMAAGCSSSGSTCTKTETVTVITGSQAVEEIVLILEETTLDRKTKRPFIATLKASEASFDRLNCVSGVNQLEAFINKVRAQVTPEDPMAAAELIYATEAAIAAFEQYGCSTP